MANIRDKSIAFLARREHSQLELRRKLSAQGFSDDLIENELNELLTKDLQCDARFTESYIRTRRMSGFGPRRIAAELRSKGVSETLIEENINIHSDEWWEQMTALCEKRFSDNHSRDKQFRFLLQKGYTPEAIHRWLRTKK